MKLSQLFSVFSPTRWGNAAGLEVLGVTQDSRHVRQGYVFVAIRGTAADGHRFLPQAAKAGALALVVEDEVGIPADYAGAVVKRTSTRQALDLLAQRFFGNPGDELFCIGVTGTNGKTTVTYMIEAILTRFGWPTGVIGTIDHHLGDRHWVSELTTPDALTLQRRLREFVGFGARAAAFEVSSHALDQSRVSSLPFAVGVFTNFTRDHLDYHGTMGTYFSAKEKLFVSLLGRNPSVAVAVLNGDDPWVRKTQVKAGVKIWWYGQNEADFRFRVLRQDLDGTIFSLSTPDETCEVMLPCPGLHNVYNACAAMAASLSAGCPLKTAVEALGNFRGAPGRLEKVPNDRGLHIFVDYAHTDDALRMVLRTLAQARDLNRDGGRIITVFGCGGDRDRGKRPLMARAAAEFSDVLVVTSDNPRFEDPRVIIEDILAGLSPRWNGEKHVEVDRHQGISRALQCAHEGDVILIAGKGHEDYQLIGDQKLPFSDKNEVLQRLKG
jgi:UDP-N-acetylmuramoyl-L-alanyl-D-glutamate--2,6-diaminopimelate ligase